MRREERIDRPARRLARLTLSAAGLTAVVAATASAATTRWIDPAGGLFVDGGNWDAGVPGAGDIATFALDAGYDVSFLFGSANNQQLHVTRGDVTFDLRRRTYELSADPSVNIALGATSRASLTLETGTLRAAQSSLLATGLLSNGTVHVSGGATFDAGDLVLGGMGGGTITVDDGGELITGTAMLGTLTDGFLRGRGTVVLDGPGATWRASRVYAGGTDALPAGNATIDVLGGTLDVGGLVQLWPRATVTMTGGRIEAGSIRGDGTLNWTGGTLRIEGGGLEIDQDAPLGATPVVGAGMLFDVRGDLRIGRTADAELTVADGGEVRAMYLNTDTVLGAAPGVHGGLVLDGPGTSLSGEVFVGGKVGSSSGPGTLTVRGGATGEGGLVVGGGSGTPGTAVLEGAGSGWTVWSSRVLRVGDFGDGTCDVRAGAVLSCPEAVVGATFSRSGVVTIDGEGSRWDVLPTTQRDLVIGEQGTGALVVSNGGVVALNRYATARVGWYEDAAGAVTVQGAGSRWDVGEPDRRKAVYVGIEGQGTLDVLDGGAVAGWQGIVGQYIDSTGAVLVSGPGSTLELSNLLAVAGDGDGSLTVADGGDVSTTGLFVASGGEATGAITVDDATLRVVDGDVGTPELVLGGNGVATVLVTNGGALTGGYAFIGDGLGAGTLTVEGAGSSFALDEELDVGFGGAGALIVRDGGAARNGATLVAVSPGSSGAITLDGTGSAWTITGTLVLGGTVDLPGGDATLAISAGGAVDVASTVLVHPTARIDLDGGTIATAGLTSAGVVSGAGTITGDVVNAGLIAPGLPHGTLHVQGALATDEAEAGTIALELGGLERGDGYDTVDLTGVFTAGGTLDVRLADGFTPAPGDAFEVIRAAAVEGAFDVVAIPAELELVYDADAIVLQAAGGPCPADLDGNGRVDVADLLAVLAAWGPYDPCPPYRPEDIDRDCAVGFGDLIIVLADWGQCPE